MVRRVRLGRRADGRPSAWAGPPPLLLVATLVGLVVAPLVAHDPPAREPAAALVASAPLTPLVAGPAMPYRVSTAPTPLRLAPIEVGLATMNLYRDLAPARAAADIRRLTARADVDVVGWQEADPFVASLRDVPGWTTKTFARGESLSELAISWRSAKFRMVSARQVRVAAGLGWRDGRYPFDTRQVVVVRLRHRATGRVLTVLNTHLPQKIEDPDHPGRWLDTINAGRAREQLRRVARIWTRVDGRWVVGTGDFNFGARADALERPVGGPKRALQRVAVSSYQRLGVGIGPTHRPTARNIDYVWVDRAGVRKHRITPLGQEALTGYYSDHRPLLVQLRLA